MKKLITFLCLLFIGINVFAQETPPSGLKAVNSQFYIHLPDSTIWQNKGAPYGYHRVGKWSDFSTFATLSDLSKKADSARLYGTMLPLYLLKSDSTGNHGFVSNYALTHNTWIWGGNQTFNQLTITDQLFFGATGIKNGAETTLFLTSNRNDFSFSHYDGITTTPLLRISGAGHGADNPYIQAFSPLVIKPTGTSKFQPTSSKYLIVSESFGTGAFGLDTIPLSNIGAIAGVSNKADSARVYNGSQNIYRNVTGTYVRKISYALGDSYTVGVGASVTKYNYITQYANMSGDSIVNSGISSSTLLHYPPFDPAGVLSLDETYTTSIPTYNPATMNRLFIAYGFNDHRVSYPVDTFKTHYNVIINYAKTTKGWPAQSIVLVSPWYMPPTFYSSLFGQPVPNETQKLAYVAAVQSLSSTNGTKYADTYNLIKGGIKRLGMAADSIHGNNTNYAIVGKYLNGIVKYTIQQNNQRLAVQGLTELSSLKLSTDDTLKTTNYTPVAADSTGRLRKAPNAYVLANPADAQGASINLAGDVQSSRLYVAQTPPVKGYSVYGAEFNVPVRVNAIYATGGFVAPPGNALSMFISAGEGYITSYNADSAKYNTLRINPGNTGTTGGIGQVVIGTGDARYVKSTVKLGVTGNVLSTAQFVGSQGLLATGTGTNFGSGTSLQYTGGNGYLYVQGGGPLLLQHSNQGGVHVNSSSDIPSAILSARSSTKGFSMPIQNTTQQNAIASPAQGLSVWNNSFAAPAYYNSVNWRMALMVNQVTNSNGFLPFGNATDATLALPLTAQGVTYTAAAGSGTWGLGNITPTTVASTIKETSIFRTPTGTAGTDSVAVKIGSTGKIGAISPTYYAVNATIKIDNYLSKTANYTVLTSDWVPGKTNVLFVDVDATSGAVIITLPAASALSGYQVYVSKTDASVNTVTINTVTGGSTLLTQDQSRQFNSNGTIWRNR